MTELKLKIKYNVSAFSMIGLNKTRNDDRILVNNEIYNDGLIQFENLNSVTGFVADGIGGNQAGDFASEYVLKNILLNINNKFDIQEKKYWGQSLIEINSNLLSSTIYKPNLKGAGTTLSGFIAENDNYLCLSVGDSQIWFGRNNDLFKISDDQVLDTTPNSPLISYFGGREDNLKIEFYSTISDLKKGDIFLLCTDGLLKVLSFKKLKSIMFCRISNSEKARTVYELVKKIGSIDDVSCIFIEILTREI
jgi:protein phosphatase